MPKDAKQHKTRHFHALQVASEAMQPVALTSDRDYYTRAANEDCINGGPRTRTKYLYDSAGYLNKIQDAIAGTPFWTLTGANDSSAPTMEVLGNAVSIATGYTPWTNEMVTRTEGSAGSTTNLQNLSYGWDLNGNLLNRVDNRQNLTEAFTLDALNRLSTVKLNGVQTLSVQYDQAGDIINKSDVSATNYTYGNAAHPHAVTQAGSWAIGYDANGNMNSRAGGAITSYSYNLPSQINYNGSSSQFNYDSSHQRWKQVANYAGTTETTHYIGGLFQVVTLGTSPTEYRHQIPAGSSTAVYTRRSDGTTGTYYATSDHLGSADLVMDSAANVLVRESFSPFGARRGSNWQSIPTTADYIAIQSTTRQGFTGHEMLDSVGLVHMNGRVYDPTIGRFLSADAVIQSLGATQSINPYSYAWNNPLTYTDPSGHSLLGAIVGLIAAYIVINYAPYLLGEAYGYGQASFGATVALAGFVGGFVNTAISTGNLEAAYTAGVIGAVTAGLFFAGGFIGSTAGSPWEITENVLAHAAVGCASAFASGGNCGKGALSAAIADAATPHIIKSPSVGVWSSVPEAAEVGLIGGAVARIEGGKFDDGFSVAAAGYLFNQMSHRGQDHNTRGEFAVQQAQSQGSALNNPNYFSPQSVAASTSDNGTSAANVMEAVGYTTTFLTTITDMTEGASGAAHFVGTLGRFGAITGGLADSFLLGTQIGSMRQNGFTPANVSGAATSIINIGAAGLAIAQPEAAPAVGAFFLFQMLFNVTTEH